MNHNFISQYVKSKFKEMQTFAVCTVLRILKLKTSLKKAEGHTHYVSPLGTERLIHSRHMVTLEHTATPMASAEKLNLF